MKLSFNPKVIFVFLLILSPGKSMLGQNLVYNPSFEIIDKCPDAGDLGPELITFAKGWTNPNMASPDLMCNCEVPFPINLNYLSCYEDPLKGRCVAGLYVFGPTGFGAEREYIQGKLIHSLIAGNEYCIKFYVSLCEGASVFEIKSLGVFFSKERLSSLSMHNLQLPAQIMQANYLNNAYNGWHLIKGSFIASGGESYIIIGNFLPDSLTDTLRIQSQALLKDASYYLIDNISVECCDPMGCGLTIPNGITPNGDGYNETWKIEGLVPGVKVQVFNRWGNIVFKSNSYDGNWDGGGLPDGTYYYLAQEPGGELYKGFLYISR